MPIYAYKCDSCGFAKDVLRKMSDPPLTVCPECGADTFSKQVTAAGFQLKGSGWYVTDFRSNNATKPAAEAQAGVTAGEGKADAPEGAKAESTSKPDAAAASGGDASGSVPAAKKEATKVAAAPASAPKPSEN